MSIPDLTVGGVAVQVKIGPVTACSYNNCCVFIRRPTDAAEDVVKLEVSRDGKINTPRENIEISLRTPYLFDVIKGNPVLRPYNRSERLTGQRKRDRLVRATLNSYYNILAQQYGPEITAIALLWQGIDFIEMYNKADPLCIFHIQKISEGMKHVSTVKKTMDFMLRNFRERLRKSSAGIDEVKILEHMRERALDLASMEARAKALSKEALDRASSRSLLSTRSFREWRVIHDDDVDNELFEIAERRGLGKKATMLKITRTLNALRNEGQRAKPLTQICSSKELDHLSKSKAEQFIRFALHLRNVYAAIAKDEGRAIPEDGEAEPPDDKAKVVAKFRKLKVPERFSESPADAYALKEDDKLDSFVGHPVVSLSTGVGKEKDEEESTLETITTMLEGVEVDASRPSGAVLVDVDSTEEMPLEE